MEAKQDNNPALFSRRVFFLFFLFAVSLVKVFSRNDYGQTKIRTRRKRVHTATESEHEFHPPCCISLLSVSRSNEREAR